MNETVFFKSLYSKQLSKDDLYKILTSGDEYLKDLRKAASETKEKYVGNIVYYRGLIEFSNICEKNCLYCGIRSGNNNVKRYLMTDNEVVSSAILAHSLNYGSLVLQSGERSDKFFVDRITNILKKIHKATNSELRITLSLGEQTGETYRIWRENGADRYLLRIEASSEDLYKKIHPDDANHSYTNRIKSIEYLRKLNYQVGSGVMIGLPFQTIDHLVNDLLFLQEYDIDMVGMGPYIEHKDTPLYNSANGLLPKEDRFNLSLKMIAALRILMKDINIAATTAMQTLNPFGREKAIMFGANVVMPNISPTDYKKDYLLYNDKSCIDENAEDCSACLDKRVEMTGNEIGYGKWGDSKHYGNNCEL